MNYDAAAARIVLGNQSDAAKSRAFAKLARAAAVQHGQECPECGSHAIEDNGHRGRWQEFRCCRCDHRFGPGTEA